MAVDLNAQLKTFFASAPQNKRVIQVVEISHSAITTEYLWREPYSGSVTLEDDSTVTLRPVNMKIDLATDDETLDQEYQISIDTTNADDELRDTLDLIPIDTTEKITVTYREYISDNLTEPGAVVILQAESIAYIKGAATISAVTPRLNSTRTGALYTFKRFPMLRGFS